jgi:MoaA/NifB/PqqE/SkfB family radical SAM enzyme
MAVADKDKDKIKLKYITIQLTLSCNYKCIMCNRYEDSTKNKFLPINDALRVIKEAKSIGVEMILLSGGEPLVYPWINEIIDKVKELNLGITFITNGMLLNEQIIKKMEGHPTRYMISMHASNKKLNDKIRGVESDYDKVIENIKLIKKSMKNNENTKLEIAIVIMDENKKDFKKISSMLFSIGITKEEIGLLPIDYEMRSNKYEINNNLSLQEIRDYFKDYLSGKLNKTDSLLAENRGFFYYYVGDKNIIDMTRADIFDFDKFKMICQDLYDHIYIMSTGDVAPCCIVSHKLTKNNIMTYGNIHKSSLKDIINSKKATEFIKSMNPITTLKDYYKDVCINCDDIEEIFVKELEIRKSKNLTDKRLIDFLKVKNPDTFRELFVNNISNNNCDEGRNLGLDYDLKNHSYEFLKQIIEENYELGIEKIILMGREPTLHPNLLSIIRFIKSKGMEVEIHTNARMFFYEEYTKKIALSGINKIFVHFMSENEEEHDEITQSKCSFKQSKKGVINLIKYLGEEKVNVSYDDEITLPFFLENTKYSVKKFKSYYENLIKNENIPENIVPYEIELDVTYKCNLKCKMCYVPDWNKKNIDSKETLSFARIKALIDEFAELGVKSIVIPGGEPLLRQDIYEIIEHISKKGLKGCIQTNGTLMTEKIADFLCRNDWKIFFSFDGSKSKIHDLIRGEGSFDLALSGLKKILKMKSKYNKGDIIAHLVIQKENVNNLFEFADFFGELGAKPICDFMGEDHAGRIDEKTFDDFNNLIKEVETNPKYLKNRHFNYLWNWHGQWSDAVKNGTITKDDLISGRPSLPLLRKQKFNCLIPHSAVISAFGEVYPCCTWFILSNCDDTSNSAGNILNKTFREIWFGKEFNKIRKEIMPVDMNKDPCKSNCADCTRYFQLEEIQEKVFRGTCD